LFFPTILDEQSMAYGATQGGRNRQNARAAIFVDYENIFHTLNEKSQPLENVEKLVCEMLEALKRSLLEERGTQTAVARAYADFANLDGTGDTVQRVLYLQGVESRFVPASLQANAVELQLCIDAMDTLHYRADVDTFVLLTGRRRYVPLIQHFKRFGKRVLVAAMEDPESLDDVRDSDGAWFLDARGLLSSTAQEAFDVDSDASSGLRNGLPIATGSALFRSIEDPLLIRTLEIIDAHFGQYEEVYLTPLLRKMSEILDDPTCDPKALVSDLEQHLAVRLEKRQGFPHDYTVLIVNRDHPDAARVLQVAGHGEPSDFDDTAPAWNDDGPDNFEHGDSVYGEVGDRSEYVWGETGPDFNEYEPSFNDFDDEFDDDESAGEDYDPSKEG
jgi:uncharacterized LabA/DUF88 family protein